MGAFARTGCAKGLGQAPAGSTMRAGPPRPIGAAGSVRCPSTPPPREADADPAGLRGPAAPGGLPEDGRKACRTPWADVDVLLAKVRLANQP